MEERKPCGKLPIARDGMCRQEFDKMMDVGLQQAKKDCSKPIKEVFTSIRQQIINK